MILFLEDGNFGAENFFKSPTPKKKKKKKKNRKKSKKIRIKTSSSLPLFFLPFSCRRSGMTSYSVPKDKIKEKKERHAVVE